MSFKGIFEWTLKKLGRDDPAITIAAICATNAIAKPIITMSNKKESPERKKFAALTESMTELTALGLCIPSTMIFQKIIAPKVINNSLPKDKQATLIQFASLSGLIAANLLIAPVATQMVKLFTSKNKNQSKQNIADVKTMPVVTPFKPTPNKLTNRNSEIYNRFLRNTNGIRV